jgi:hypothetical protein
MNTLLTPPNGTSIEEAAPQTAHRPYDWLLQLPTTDDSFLPPKLRGLIEPVSPTIVSPTGKITFYGRIRAAAARTILREHNPNNRHLRVSVSAWHATMFLRGEYCETHQGVAFDQMGNLADRQHTLDGLAQAGMSFVFLITLGLTTEDIKRIDDHERRSVADRLRLAGDQAVSPDHITCLKRLLAGTSTKNRHCRKITLGQIEDLLAPYRDAVFFAVRLLPKGPACEAGIAKGAVWAGLAAAYYYEPLPYLEDVGHLLKHAGEPVPDWMGPEAAPIIKLQHILAGKDRHARGNDSVTAVQSKVKRAVEAYCGGEKPLERILATTNDIYQLPSPEEALRYQPRLERTRPLQKPVSVRPGPQDKPRAEERLVR